MIQSQISSFSITFGAINCNLTCTLGLVASCSSKDKRTYRLCIFKREDNLRGMGCNGMGYIDRENGPYSLVLRSPD